MHHSRARPAGRRRYVPRGCRSLRSLLSFRKPRYASSLLFLLAPMIVFAQNPEILVNAQGWAQTDLSIRGSSYTGAGISLNGLPLKAPYSAHYNSEIPFPSSLLSAPEAQTGLDNISGHLIGTAAYQISRKENHLQAAASIGTKEHYTASISGQAEGVGAFAEWEKARRIDYSANDLERHSAGAYLQHVVNDWQIDVIGAHQQKEFGAQGYYGNPSYTELTVDDSLLFVGATKGDLDDAFLRASSAFRQMTIDDIDSRHGAVAIEGRTMEIQHIAFNLRGNVENEYADGNDRTRGTVLILPEARFERSVFKAGLNTIFQTAESAEFLPQAGFDWFTTDNSTLYASYSENVQQPDFRTVQNNPLLQQQRVQNTEVGFRQFVSARLDWRAAAFHRRLEHASDWIAGAATDLGTLNVAGLESEISFYPSEALELRAFYQWIHKDNDLTGGLYETDYPEHMLNMAGFWVFAPDFTLFAAQRLRYQAANPARTSSDFGAEASLGLHWSPPFANNARLSLLVDNLWGTNFQAIPGLKPTARTVSTGITVTW